MRYNQFIFTSDIAENRPEEIIRRAADKHLDTMIVALPIPQNQDQFWNFIQKLNEYDIPYDCFLPNFDIPNFNYAVKKMKETSSNRLWVRINEGKLNYDVKTLKTAMISPDLDKLEIVVVSQTPYFFRPGTLTHRFLDATKHLDVSVSPIIPLDVKPTDTGYIQKAILTFAEKYKTVPSLYYAPESKENTADFIVGYLNNSILPYCNEISLMNWKGTNSMGFSDIYSRIYVGSPKKAERIDKVMAEKKKSAKKTFPREMTVIVKSLGKRKTTSLRSDVVGNLRYGDIVNVKSIFSDMDGTVFAEIIPDNGPIYYVLAEVKGEKTIQNL